MIRDEQTACSCTAHVLLLLAFSSPHVLAGQDLITYDKTLQCSEVKHCLPLYCGSGAARQHTARHAARHKARPTVLCCCRMLSRLQSASDTFRMLQPA
jgi:hypothetical protein